MSTPTPGPWTVTVFENSVFIHGGPNNDDIADFSFKDEHTVSISKDEAIANATLCAVAPDLLEALKLLLACPEISDAAPEDKDGETHHAESAARAAIARAEGTRAMSGPMTTADDDEDRQRPDVLKYTVKRPHMPELLRVDVAGVSVMVRGEVAYKHLTQVNHALCVMKMALHKIVVAPTNAQARAHQALQDIKGSGP